MGASEETVRSIRGNRISMIFQEPMTSLNPLHKVEKQVNRDDGTPSFIKFDTKTKSQLKGEAKKVLSKHLSLKENDDLKSLSVERDKIGFTHEKFSQYYKGVPVEGGTYKVHSKNGMIESINGNFKSIKKDININPGISEKQALKKALTYVGAKKYMWESPGNEKFAQETEKSKTYYPKGELVIVNNSEITKNSGEYMPVLAYKFNIYAEYPVSRAYIYVDAHKGKIVHTNEIIHLTPLN